MFLLNSEHGGVHSCTYAPHEHGFLKTPQGRERWPDGSRGKHVPGRSPDCVLGTGGAGGGFSRPCPHVRAGTATGHWTLRTPPVWDTGYGTLSF